MLHSSFIQGIALQTVSRNRAPTNNVLHFDFRPARDGPIRRRRQLGGIITSYTRDAA